jgi:hypothetical protein
LIDSKSKAFSIFACLGGITKRKTSVKLPMNRSATIWDRVRISGVRTGKFEITLEISLSFF